MKTKTKPKGSDEQKPTSKPATTCEGIKRSFCDEAMKIIDWACTGSGEWEWPINSSAGLSNETWVRDVFKNLEMAFDPAFYKCKQRKADESDNDFQNRVDAERMTRQRDLAATLWECDPKLAGRYADILRAVKKPAGLPDVDKRVAFLQEIERRDEEGRPTNAEDAVIGMASAMQGKTGNITINGMATKLKDYGSDFHNENGQRVKLLWIDTTQGRYVLSHIENGKHIGRPTELTFQKEGDCQFRAVDADGKERQRNARVVSAPRKRATGERGRRQSYTTKELNNVEGSIRCYSGSIEAAAQALGKDLTEVRRMHDAWRHRQRNLNTELRKRK